jgi:hypothetical protein
LHGEHFAAQLDFWTDKSHIPKLNNLGHLSYAGTNMTVTAGANPQVSADTISNIVNASVAAATLLASIVALFGGTIKSFLGRPRIKLMINNDAPYICDVRQVDDSSSDRATESRREIRFSVDNYGKSSAIGVVAVLTKIYEKRDGSNLYYLAKTLMPESLSSLSDRGNQLRQDIATGLSVYYKLAVIDNGQMVSIDSPAMPAPEAEQRRNHRLRIMTSDPVQSGLNVVIRGKSCLIPISMYGENIKPIKFYVEILWSGNDVKDANQQNFNVKTLTLEEAQKLMESGVVL